MPIAELYKKINTVSRLALPTECETTDVHVIPKQIHSTGIE